MEQARDVCLETAAARVLVCARVCAGERSCDCVGVAQRCGTREQADSLLCGLSPLVVGDFLAFDLIGAPWRPGPSAPAPPLFLATSLPMFLSLPSRHRGLCTSRTEKRVKRRRGRWGEGEEEGEGKRGRREER